MNKIVIQELQDRPISIMNLKMEKTNLEKPLLITPGRHAAKNLKADYFIDLTSEDEETLKNNKCFVCNQLIDTKLHSLRNSVTNTSKKFIAQKLGEIMGKSFIVVVSEDDYICQHCFNLFNQIDNIEVELNIVKNRIKTYLEHTYFEQGKVKSILPNEFYKYLQNLIEK